MAQTRVKSELEKHMEYVQLSAAKSVIQAILDSSNPQASSEALAIRDKWLLENDRGILQMTPEIRSLLEQVSEYPSKE